MYRIIGEGAGVLDEVFGGDDFSEDEAAEAGVGKTELQRLVREGVLQEV